MGFHCTVCEYILYVVTARTVSIKVKEISRIDSAIIIIIIIIKGLLNI
jgi:hypothetical protein